MDKDDWNCQNCLARLVEGQVEEGVAHSREEDGDSVAAGAVSDPELVEKEAVMQATDMGTPLGCKDPKRKVVYSWSLRVGDCHPAFAVQSPDTRPQTLVTSQLHCHYCDLKLFLGRMAKRWLETWRCICLWTVMVLMGGSDVISYTSLVMRMTDRRTFAP